MIIFELFLILRLSQDLVCVNLLRFYCVYILFLALNGITEGFYNATMSEPELKQHNYRLIIFSITFLAGTFVLAKLFHVNGFLMANCVNMFFRTAVSSVHIRAFFSTPQLEYSIWKAYFPDWKLLVIYSVALVVTKMSENAFYNVNPYLHLFIGVLIFLFNFLAIFKFERRMREFAIKFLKKVKLA